MVESHQSPLLSLRARELELSLLAFPAAAEAKLEGNGDGMIQDCDRFIQDLKGSIDFPLWKAVDERVGKFQRANNGGQCLENRVVLNC